MRQPAIRGIVRLAAGALLALALAPAPAHAYRVYSPNVTPGETAVGFWGEATSESSAKNKPGSKRGLVEVRHTFFDRLDLGIGAVGESGANGTAGSESIGYSRLKLRGVLQLTEPKAHFLDTGLYVDYQIVNANLRKQIPDFLNVFVLLQKDFDTWYVNFNPGVRKKMATFAGVSDNVAQYQAGFKYRLHQYFNPGAEAYGVTLGGWDKFAPADQQIQYAGPAFHGDLPPYEGFTVHYEGALLFGLSTASYNMMANAVLEIRF